MSPGPAPSPTGLPKTWFCPSTHLAPLATVPLHRLFSQLRTHFLCFVPDLSSSTAFSRRLSLTSPTGPHVPDKGLRYKPSCTVCAHLQSPCYSSNLTWVHVTNVCPPLDLRPQPPEAKACLHTWMSPVVSLVPSGYRALRKHLREGGRGTLQEATETQSWCVTLPRGAPNSEADRPRGSKQGRQCIRGRHGALGTPQGGPPNSARGRWSEQTVLEKRIHLYGGKKMLH